jgi:D-alanyl-D-alanine dipeptidase
MKKLFVRIFSILISVFLLQKSYCQEISIPDFFVDVSKELPSVELEIRYFSENNFIGSVIEGYKAPKAYLTKQAFSKLVLAQQEFLRLGYRIKIFDAYRPQRAVDHFVRWAKDEKDTLMKSQFYPNVAKKDLFKLDYIASKSGHSRGSTLDLTLVNIKTGKEIDMGSSYDYFGKISWPFAKAISENQKENRMLLRRIMLVNGFKPYVCEWWHFTLKNEPYPETYFNFPVL